jgi:putative DNA primase/helicase
MKNNITPELIRAALAHIPATCDRETWARVAMAIKSEYPDSTGRDLFTDWSATADTFDPKATAATWRSVKAGGGVGVGTLLRLAKEGGFTLPKPDQAPAAPSPEALAQRERERAESQRREQARTDAAHDQAAGEAAAMFGDASDTGQSAYLERKGVQAHGVRFTPDGWALVPMRDAAGKLWNLQRIAPVKPSDGGTDKLFLKGGRKSGLWHWCGTPEGAPVLIVCEGYATAASVHQATGRPTACAFDAGNLQPVARTLRKLHPAALILIAGDDDKATEARTGTNPGRLKSEAAARAVRGLAVFPDPLPEGGSDFNDLHQASGLDAVRAVIEAAIQAHQAAQSAPHAAPADRQGNPAHGTRHAPQGGEDAHDTGRAFDRYHTDSEGVWFTPPGDDGAMPRKVCGPLRVTGLARDGSDNQAALLLEFDTAYRAGRRWLMPLSMLAGDGAAFRSALLSQGFMTPTDAKRRGWLTEYLQSRAPAELVRHVPRVGWHGRCYVLPEETLGTNPSGDRVIFHSEAGIEARFSQRGTLERWRQDLARLCIGNSRFCFATATAFAGPLLAWAAGTTGGGFQLTGPTSIGKTTAFLIAASVWGKGTENDPESYIQKWRGTANGFEYLGEQHNDATLILDEMGQIDAVEAGQVAYMLADGAGKSRAKAGGGLRQKPTWRTLFLSSGEVSLEQHMRTAGKVMKGGQEVRLIPIPAEVLPGSAAETNHEFDGGHELSGWVKQHAARCYGTAGRAWLEYLVSHTEGLAATLRERMNAVEAQIVPESAAGQVQRGGRRFALVAAAGELATEAGLTGWPAGEATRAARACFEAWIQSRGGSGSSEVTAILRGVRRFLEAHGEGRFAMWHRGSDDHAPKTLNRAGVRRMLNADGEPIKTNNQHGAEFGDRMPAALGEGVSFEYFITAEVFTAEVCGGADRDTVCRVLLEHGCLIPDKGRTFDCKPRLPGLGLTRCYRIPPAIFELDL